MFCSFGQQNHESYSKWAKQTLKPTWTGDLCVHLCTAFMIQILSGIAQNREWIKPFRTTPSPTVWHAGRPPGGCKGHTWYGIFHKSKLPISSYHVRSRVKIQDLDLKCEIDLRSLIIMPRAITRNLVLLDGISMENSTSRVISRDLAF